LVKNLEELSCTVVSTYAF